MPRKSTAKSKVARSRMDEHSERMQWPLNRVRALEGLEELFQGGTVPEPFPMGFQKGRLLGMSFTPGVDAALMRVARAWMPWKGKSFDAEQSTGVNIMSADARVPLKIVFPGYQPERDHGDRLEVFPFRNWVGSGAVDPDLKVYKIDYDFDANPNFLIRKILDELVQIDEGLYLGKILMRYRAAWHRVGYFSLENPS